MTTVIPQSVHIHIRIRSARGGDYPVEMHVGEAVYEWTCLTEPELFAPYADVEAYGRYLFEWLLGRGELRTLWESLLERFPARRTLHLQIDDDAPELHALSWELMHDGKTLLATDEHTPLVRYYATTRTAPRPTLQPPRVLVALAAPNGTEGSGIPPIDVQAERNVLGSLQARTDVDVDMLGIDEPCTLAALDEALARGYHVFHFVGHGMYDEASGAHLQLATADNQPHWVNEQAFVTMMRRHVGMDEYGVNRPLRLVTFASCQTAQRSPVDPYLGLASKLVQIGAPAVVAMQRWVQIWQAHNFFQMFYKELVARGNVEIACNRARAAAYIAAMPGAGDDATYAQVAMPVLYSHLSDGMLWLQGGLDEGDWPILLENARKGRCTPVLGPDFNRVLLGSRRELARRWAESYNFPLSLHERDDLTQVSQYLEVRGGRAFPRDVLVEHLRSWLMEDYAEDLRVCDESTKLDDLIVAAGVARMRRNAYEPYHVLAHMNAKVVVNTSPTSLLLEAYKLAGKEPCALYFPWNQEATHLNCTNDAHPTKPPIPDAQHPLVYYLFGHLRDPYSYVLTEDDHFDFLIRVSREDRSNQELFPSALLEALSSTSLVFLGFRLDDWAFRVLFRWLMTRNSGELLSKYRHVAIQLNLSDTVVDVEEARKYLEEIFEARKVAVYWGSVESFMKELGERLEVPPVARPAMA